jgi:hypothetical protein
MGPNPQQPRFSPLQRVTSLEITRVEFHPVPFERVSDLFFINQLSIMRFLVEDVIPYRQIIVRCL